MRKRHITSRAAAISGFSTREGMSLWFVLLGTIVSIGDPKKKYTRYEKIGQG